MTSEHVLGDKLPFFVIAVWVVWLQDAKPVLDSQSGGDDEKASAKAVLLREPKSAGLPVTEMIGH